MAGQRGWRRADDVGGRAAGYARVSTAAQVEHGLSLEEQESRLRAFISDQGMTCVELFIDAGVSGRRADKRPQLQRLLEAAERRAFDVLVIPSLDRLGRSARDLHEILATLTRCGVAVRSLRGDVDISSATGTLLTSVMASIAEFESNLIGERVSIGKAASAAKGRRNGGPRPFGYLQAGGKLTLVDDEAQVLRECRSRYVAGNESLSEICRTLNRRGVRTASGARWSQSRLSAMFKNTLYVGRVHYKGEDYEGTHEPVFTCEEWDELQAHLDSRRRRPGRGQGRTPGQHLFPGGVIRCSRCGSSVIPRRTTNGQGRVYELYACGGKLSGASPDCTMPSIRREALDSAVIEYFANVALDVEETRRRFGLRIEAALAETERDLEHADHQRARAVARLARVRRAFQDEGMKLADWEDQRDELEGERDKALDEVSRLRAQRDQIAAEGERLDAGEEVLRYLTDLRASAASRFADTSSLAAVRVALLRVVDGFTLHSFAAPMPETPADPPTGWLRSRLYLPQDLLIAGGGGFLLEPHPRREAILDPDKEVPFPELRRVALDARVRATSSGR